ncbi:KTSC domain-containing protein [Kribbella lupini]|uniref:KTSC domain-containing protein n=1 Tax=Kribbella lupini TaxID=291602 RepID=A0ABN2CSY3_9ACTN
MRRKPVNSSSVQSFGWEDGTLEVEFVSGDVYQYFEVSEFTYAALARSDSVGRFINTRIKPHHDFKEV